MRKYPQPSMRAASSSSLGIVEKNWRIKKTPKTLNNPGSTRPMSVSVRPNLTMSLNRGMMKICPGTIISASMHKNSRFLPGKRSRSNAYAQMVTINSWPIIISTVTTIVLKYSCGKFSLSEMIA